MSSPNKGNTDSNSIPFEPKPKKKKAPTNKLPPVVEKKAKEEEVAKVKSQPSSRSIPEVVSKRMVKRMFFFSGIPTVFGLSSFFIAYLIVKAGVKLPPYAVLAVSFGLFGLGVVGLTYGILSASWDEERVGTWLGWSEFKVNFSRTYKALRSKGEEKDYSNS